MKTASLISAIALGLRILSAPLAADAQQAAKVYRMGYLSIGVAPTPSTPDPIIDAFRQRLRELGYVEGENLVVDYRWAEGRYDRLPPLAAELVRLNPNVIVTRASSAAIAAKHATSTIPIVMASSLDPVREGIVASLARPGGNVTGMMSVSDPDIIAKRLQLLKEALPRMSRLAIVTTLRPFPVSVRIWIRDTEAAAKALGLKLQIVEVQDPSRWDDAFAAIVRARSDALYPIEWPAYVAHRRHIADLALKHRIPTIFGLRTHVEAGGLMSYGADLRDTYRRAAEFVDRILKGANPADLPVEQATKFELVINLKTAKALGLTIPQSVLMRADEVIQ